MVNYFLSSVEETLDIPPDITSAKKRNDLLKCKYVSVVDIFPSYGITPIPKKLGHRCFPASGPIIAEGATGNLGKQS